MCSYLTCQAIDCVFAILVFSLVLYLFFCVSVFWLCLYYFACIVWFVHHMNSECFWITTLPSDLDLFAWTTLINSVCTCIYSYLPVVMLASKYHHCDFSQQP